MGPVTTKQMTLGNISLFGEKEDTTKDSKSISDLKLI